MDEQNLKYLKDDIRYIGFGGKNLNEVLQSAMKNGNSEFQIVYESEIDKKLFKATLHFQKLDTTDMYFFSSYRASLQKSNSWKADQTFYINKGKGFTVLEAFNLLDGRSVN